MSEDKALEKLNTVSTAKRLASMVRVSEDLVLLADCAPGTA